MVLAIWESNHLIQKNIPAEGSRVHPLIIQFFVSLFGVVLISLIITYFFPLVSGTVIPVDITFKLALGFAFRVNLFLNCINAIAFFMTKNRQNEIEKEILYKETAEARFAALRNQINPHFLFNSFNVLSALIHKDSETATQFIEQLSKVYRYLLNNQNNKVVTIREELDFLDAYVFLLNIRFGKSLNIDNQMAHSTETFHIAPATLQMLMENAIKHNIISKADPLTIKIYRENRYVVVENFKQLKPVQEESTGTGLHNIRQRYKYLCKEDSVIIESNGTFIVKIPILEIDDEGTDR
jgi:two-component system, LytTR family, sensor kinase